MAGELHFQPPLLGNPISNPAAPPAPAPGSDTLGPKRHRRPSVRLGDIGDQPATIRSSKPNNASTKSSKIRPLTNLVTSSNNGGADLDYSNCGGFMYSHQSKKSRRTIFTTKRVRTNFKLDHDDDDLDHGHGHDHDQQLFEDRENGDNTHEFDVDDNHTSNTNNNNAQDIDIDGLDEDHQSPIQSDEDEDDTTWQHQHRSNRRRGNLGFGLDDGVRNWLMDLGLARYAPLFEIHEVDFQVLPFLTLEDLKDMGIHAVGSRRKFFSAILNLRKN